MRQVNKRRRSPGINGRVPAVQACLQPRHQNLSSRGKTAVYGRFFPYCAVLCLKSPVNRAIGSGDGGVNSRWGIRVDFQK